MGKVEDATATMIANLPDKTGKPLDAWLKIVTKTKLQKHGEIVSMLKADHGIGHGFANLIAHRALASDVEFAPKKAYVSLRRSKQFGLIQPSTATRLDLGLNLKGVAPDGRLEAAGSWNAMCTHRVKLSSAADVDAAVKSWLKRAYDAA